MEQRHDAAAATQGQRGDGRACRDPCERAVCTDEHAVCKQRVLPVDTNLTSTPSEASHEGEKKRGAPNGSESDQTRISFVVQDLEGKRGSILPNADMPIDVDSDLDSEISDFFDGIS